MKKLSEEDKLADIRARYAQLKNERAKFHDRWTEAQKFVDSKMIVWDGKQENIPDAPVRYASSPCNYLQTLTAGLIGYSVSPHIVWFKLSLEQQELLNLYGVKDFLEECERRIYAEMNRSNLYRSIDSFVSDGGVLGHAALLVDEDRKRNGIRYTKMPANEIYMDINENGDVDTIYRVFYMTLRNAVKKFGLEKLDQTLQQDYEEKSKWNNSVQILEAIFPREEYNPKFKNNINMPYACIYIDNDHGKIIDESGYNEFPFAIFEWDRFDNFAYSSSPAQKAIEDIKFLNIAKKTSAEIAQTSAEPPMRISEEVRNINLNPSGFNYVPSPDSVIEPIKTGENYPITLQVTQDIQQQIKDWFYVDFFLMLQQKNAQMTATEVQELQGEKAATLSSLIVNLNNALQTVIERTFNIMLRNGMLPDIPPALQGYAASMKVDFVGPLAQAQKKYHSMGGLVQALQVTAPIMQMFPNAADFIDGDQLMKSAMEGQGMPQNIIREDEDVNKLREERIKQQQAAQQAAQQQAMLQSVYQNANKLNEPIEQGSVMSELNQQLAGGMANG